MADDEQGERKKRKERGVGGGGGVGVERRGLTPICAALMELEPLLLHLSPVPVSLRATSPPPPMQKCFRAHMAVCFGVTRMQHIAPTSQVDSGRFARSPSEFCCLAGGVYLGHAG